MLNKSGRNPPTRDGTELHICIPIRPPPCQHFCLIQTSAPPAPNSSSLLLETGTRWWVGFEGGSWDEHEIGPIELLAAVPNCTYIGSTVTIYRPSLSPAAQFRPQLTRAGTRHRNVRVGPDCQWLYSRSNISE